MPLESIGALLPYHSDVDADVVVSALNRMVDDASGGRKVFYEFYSDDRKQDTGLFFFRGKHDMVRRLSFAFLIVNLLGFATYFLFPVAPPWYVLYAPPRTL